MAHYSESINKISSMLNGVLALSDTEKATILHDLEIAIQKFGIYKYEQGANMALNTLRQQAESKQKDGGGVPNDN